MQLSKLPVSEHVAFARNAEELSLALNRIFGDELISYFQPIEGSPCSGRLLASKEVPGCVSLPTEHRSPWGVAHEFTTLDARYAGQPKTDHHYQKGWEVRTATWGCSPQSEKTHQAIVFAAWIPTKPALSLSKEV